MNLIENESRERLIFQPLLEFNINILIQYIIYNSKNIYILYIIINYLKLIKATVMIRSDFQSILRIFVIKFLSNTKRA